MEGDFEIRLNKSDVLALATQKLSEIVKVPGDFKVRYCEALSSGDQREPLFSGVQVVFNRHELIKPKDRKE